MAVHAIAVLWFGTAGTEHIPPPMRGPGGGGRHIVMSVSCASSHGTPCGWMAVYDIAVLWLSTAGFGHPLV